MTTEIHNRQRYDTDRLSHNLNERFYIKARPPCLPDAYQHQFILVKLTIKAHIFTCFFTSTFILFNIKQFTLIDLNTIKFR